MADLSVSVSDTTPVTDSFTGGTKFDVPVAVITIRAGWRQNAYTLALG